MLQLSPKRHFQTFARLRPASLGDVTALENLERHGNSGADPLDWSDLIASDTATVVTAHEGDCLVGAAVTLQRGDAAASKLLWLGVCPSARSRGVGTLLLEAAVLTMRDNGAAIVAAEIPAGDNHLSRLLLDGGFEHRGTDTKTARYTRVLGRHREAANVIRVSFG